LLTGYTAWALASVLWAHDTEQALHRFTTNVQLLAAIWLGWQIARSRRDVTLMVVGYVLGCAVASVGAWQSFLSGVTYAEADGRYAAMGFDPNDMGVTVALAMPLAAYLVMSGAGRRPYLWLAYLPLGLSAVALSGSRGAMVTAAAAIMCVLLWVSRRSQVATLAMLGLLLGAVTIVATRSPETIERLFTIRQQLAGSGTLGERLTIWEAGLRVFLHDPVAGIGTGQFSSGVARELGYPMEAHNAFVSVLVELGVIGLLLYASAFAFVLHGAWSKSRNERTLVLAMLFTWFVGVSSLTWELRKATWFVVLLGSVVAHLAPGDEKSDGAEQDVPPA
jgi:O-antigen ligase